VALSAAGLAVGVPFVLWLGPTLFPSVEPASLRLAMLLFPPMLVEAMLLGVLQGREDFGVVNRVGVLVPATALALAAALVVWRMLGVAGALYAYAGAHAVGLGATFWALWRMRDPDRSWRTCRQYATAALDYGWRANLGNLAALVNYRADLYLLNVLLTASAVGVYAAAVQIAEKLWILSAAVSFVILPRIAALHDAEATRRRITPLMARWVLLATVGLSVGVGLFGYPVIRLMGPRFGEAIPVLWFLLPGVALLAVARVISADLAARGRPELNVVATLAGVAVEVVGIALLVPRVGLLGAASASSLSYASSCAMSLWFYGRITKVRPWTPLVPTRDDRQLIRAVGTLVGGWLRAGAPGERLGG
jgi:O-antigen/teichoic acid export membrane protein